MVKAKYHIKYPCGFEKSVYVHGLFVTVNFDDEDKCPLHGKDCIKACKTKRGR